MDFVGSVACSQGVGAIPGGARALAVAHALFLAPSSWRTMPRDQVVRSESPIAVDKMCV